MLDTADEHRLRLGRPRRSANILRLVATALDAGTLAAIIAVFVLSRLAWMLVFHLGPAELVSALCQWDCKWYLGLAEHGYSVEPHFDTFQADWAFFPGYPSLIWLTMAITQVTALVAGTLISNLAIVVGVWIGCRYLDRTRPGQGKATFVVMALAGPYSFYFATVYSEALFFLLVAAVFWLWASDRPILSAIGGAALTATRATGVLLAVTLALDLLLRHKKQTPRFLIEQPKWVVALLIMPLGLFAYMVFLHVLMGDALAFSHAQTAWHREVTFPLVWLAVGLLHFDLPSLFDPNAFSYFYSSCWVLVGIGLLTGLGFARRWTEFSFGLFCLLVPLSAGLTSMPRFIVGCPVMLFAVNDLVGRLKSRRTLMPVAMAGLVALNLPLLAAWIHGYMSMI